MIPTCAMVRERIHAALDDPADVLPESAREHLESCDACRELFDDLHHLTAALRTLPAAPLPAVAVDAVWRDTVGSRGRVWSSPGLARAAAAAVVVTAVCATTLYLVLPPRLPQEPTAAQLARASEEADMVLGYTAKALAAARTAAADKVLASKVSPAVRSGKRASAPRRTR